MQTTIANRAFFQALGTEARLRIVELLDEGPKNIKDLAQRLGVSSAIVTKHVQKLQQAGIVKSESIPAKRGKQKVCSLAVDHVAIRLRSEKKTPNQYTCSIPVGQYSLCSIKPSCGLASPTKTIGLVDDPRYFADPQHVQAAIVWFGSGWIQYRLPNFLLAGQRLLRLRVSFEICSEAPGYAEDWPSEIGFSINGMELGTWTSPGDFGATRGLLTPDWWLESSTQHGLLKTLSVQQDGSFMDGVQISGVSARDLDIVYGTEMLLRISAPPSPSRGGGVTLFGRNFGNYDQDIDVAVEYGRVGL